MSKDATEEVKQVNGVIPFTFYKTDSHFSVEKSKDKMCYKHTMKYYSSLKKKGYPVTFYNMSEPWGHHAKWNKSHKKTNTVWFYLCELSTVVKFIDK